MKSIFLYVVLTFLTFTSSTAVYSQIRDEDLVYLGNQHDYYLVSEALVGNNGATLVPEGVIRSVNDVYYVEYQYQLVVKQGYDLNILVEDLFFSNKSVSTRQLHETFDFEISRKVIGVLDQSDHLFDEHETAIAIEVTVRVSMDEPDSFELYKDLVGGQLSFDVKFFVT